ncbi:VOC family protein [Terrimonas sp. NA20]|uniref:VOC family protein n=1 Tax=Terrimonas ginsenosidimutans TaxID=2908004 RepID=A0ABS9KTU9_9BACT|nr:VOC family protein [Terrimonas ginsenosidimutans]MCG2615762.1 VOC family protein [Terrimonas ginsenosidimutans]
MATFKRFTNSLWFDTRAEEAANFYVGIFKNSSVGRIAHYTEAGKEIHGKEPGSVLTVEFELDGHRFLALNGGPIFKFNEAISFVVNCKDQEEIDYYWDKLKEGGDPKAQQCGWLKDKFGVSWQVSPIAIEEMAVDPDKEKVNRMMAALMQMKKLDLAELEKAFNGK